MSRPMFGLRGSITAVMLFALACPTPETFGPGASDAGLGASDAGRSDAGQGDAGLTPDSGTGDAGANDAGWLPDGGPGDGGPGDGGSLSCDLTGCGAGELCCAATGSCYSASCLACCMTVPPPDGGIGCVESSQCPANYTCEGTGCSTPGTCEPLPADCPAIFQPVCGCDGQTYENACFAAFAGVRVASQGLCSTTDAGLGDAGPMTCTAASCGSAQACCESTGVCYPSDCTACCPGVSPPDGGDVCTDNADCATTSTTPSLYCVGVGCTAPGICEAPPTSCTGVFAPVCGCDGQTYLNECAAAESFMRVNHQGACTGSDGGSGEGGDAGSTDAGAADAGPPDAGHIDAGGVDGGVSCTENAQCPAANDYCAGSGCGTPGDCAVRPTTCPTVVNPVCACNGETYDNECYAEAAGQRVASAGACATADAGSGTDAGSIACVFGGTVSACPSMEVCCMTTDLCVDPTCLDCCPAPADGGMSCTTNSECPSGSLLATSYCAGTGCGTPGTCQGEPPICPGIVSPVCGCDGNTYTNTCFAEQAGVRVAYDSACTTAADGGTTDGGLVTCGGGVVILVCTPGEVCCEATESCVPAACTNCCPSVADAGVGGCTTDADCSTLDYCAGTGCNTTGTCEAKPTVCPLDYSPVCGCDGNTYTNSCYAEAAGVRVASTGTCSVTQSCGGPAGILCPVDETCCATTLTCVPLGCLSCCPAATDGGTGACTTNSECPATTDYCAGTGCGTPGTCQQEPTLCPPPDPVGIPVCGCDGNTYQSECLAEQAGVRVESTGACTTSSDGGTTTCGSNGGVCGPGDVCCQFSGECVPAACLACCAPPGGGGG